MEVDSQRTVISMPRLKKPMLLGVSLFVVLTALFAWTQIGKRQDVPVDTAMESLSVKPSQQHLGKLNQFEKKGFSINLKNEGQEPIRILKVEHSCGCTEAKALREVLAPGEETQIIGSLNAENRAGEFGSQIVVSYQEGRREEIKKAKLLVGAKAVTLINSPVSLDLGASVLGQEPAQTVFEVTKGDAERLWDTLNVRGEGFKSKVLKIGEDKWQITIRPDKANVVGNFSDNLIIEIFNSGRFVESISILVYRKVISNNFSINPSNIYLKRNGDGVTRLQVISLKNKDGSVGADILLNKENKHVTVDKILANNKVYLEVKARGVVGERSYWSGPVFVVLSNKLAKETFQIMVVII